MSASSSARTRISPYARRLARERGLPIAQLRGSGPRGRIVAADVLGYVPPVLPAAAGGVAVTAFGATLELTALTGLLADFAAAGHRFELADAVLRGLGCALADAIEIEGPETRPVALELEQREVVFTDLHRQSLAPLAARRDAAESGEGDESGDPAMISLRLVTARGVRPVAMPLRGTRPMRLVLAAGETAAEALLVFDAAQVSEDRAAALLGRLKDYLEQPVRLLA